MAPLSGCPYLSVLWSILFVAELVPFEPSSFDDMLYSHARNNRHSILPQMPSLSTLSNDLLSCIHNPFVPYVTCCNRSPLRNMKVKEWKRGERRKKVASEAVAAMFYSASIFDHLSFVRFPFARGSNLQDWTPLSLSLHFSFLCKSRAPFSLTGDLTPLRPRSVVRHGGVSLLEYTLKAVSFLYLCNDISSPSSIPRPPQPPPPSTSLRGRGPLHQRDPRFRRPF